jgi:hypothetical protein
MFKAQLLHSILSTFHAHLNLLDLITLTTLDERYELKFLNVKPTPLPILMPFGSNFHLRTLLS